MFFHFPAEQFEGQRYCPSCMCHAPGCNKWPGPNPAIGADGLRYCPSCLCADEQCRKPLLPGQCQALPDGSRVCKACLCGLCGVCVGKNAHIKKNDTKFCAKCTCNACRVPLTPDVKVGPSCRCASRILSSRSLAQSRCIANVIQTPRVLPIPHRSARPRLRMPTAASSARAVSALIAKPVSNARMPARSTLASSSAQSAAAQPAPRSSTQTPRCVARSTEALCATCKRKGAIALTHAAHARPPLIRRLSRGSSPTAQRTHAPSARNRSPPARPLPGASGACARLVLARVAADPRSLASAHASQSPSVPSSAPGMSS